MSDGDGERKEQVISVPETFAVKVSPTRTDVFDKERVAQISLTTKDKELVLELPSESVTVTETV